MKYVGDGRRFIGIAMMHVQSTMALFFLNGSTHFFCIDMQCREERLVTRDISTLIF